MRAVLFLLGLLAALPAHAQSKLLQAHAAISSFTGPIDVVASPTALYSLRAGSAAIAAAGTQTLVNIRRASDNVVCDFLPALTGGFGVTTATCNSSTQGGVSYSTFVGSDGTASCTLAGTTGACTGASGTVHVNDVVTGVGLTQPCIVATASNTAPTIEIAGTTTSCGTVSVAETFTFQVASFEPKIYDQSGNGKDAGQATAGNQPQFLPVTAAGPPTIVYVGTAVQGLLSSAITALAQPFTFSWVSERTTAFTTQGSVISTFSAGNNAQDLFSGSANIALMFAGSIPTYSATDGILHAEQSIYNGASSFAFLDGTANSVNPGAGSTGTIIGLGISPTSSNPLTGYLSEAGVWPVGFSVPQRGAMHTNQSAYYGTP